MLLAALLALPACTDRRRAVEDTGTSDAVSFDAAPAVVQATDAGSPQSVAPWLLATSPNGAATLDSTLRIRTPGPGGTQLRPGGGAPGRAALAVADRLFPGDVVFTGPGSGVTLRVPADPTGGGFALGENAVVELPAYGGALLVLSLGAVDVNAPGDPLRLDTPAGRVIVAGGTATVGVAGDGAVVVLATTGLVTVWPSPPAPEGRSTHLAAAEIRQRRRNTPDHPVLLDVNLPDLAAQTSRPVRAITMTPGQLLAWDPLGAPHRHAPPVHANRAAVLRWLAAQNSAVAEPNAHLVAIGLLGRAGGGDVADARAVLTRLRTVGDTLTPQERGEAINVLSLALGRATARARRGRDLAGRGGDVTALVQLAPTEDVRDAARAVLPLAP